MTILLDQDLVWDAVPGAISYDVSLRNAAGGVELVQFEAFATHFAYETLLAGRAPGTYTVTVRALAGTFEGPWSALFEISFSPLAAPENLRSE